VPSCRRSLADIGAATEGGAAAAAISCEGVLGGKGGGPADEFVALEADEDVEADDDVVAEENDEDDEDDDTADKADGDTNADDDYDAADDD